MELVYGEHKVRVYHCTVKQVIKFVWRAACVNVEISHILQFLLEAPPPQVKTRM